MRRLFSRQAPSPRAHEVVATPPQFDKIAANGRLRLGMWVVYDKHVGILTGLTANGRAEIMMTHSDGTNRIVVLAQAAAVEQAALNDIPLARRPALSHARVYGYREKRIA